MSVQTAWTPCNDMHTRICIHPMQHVVEVFKLGQPNCCFLSQSPWSHICEYEQPIVLGYVTQMCHTMKQLKKLKYYATSAAVHEHSVLVPGCELEWSLQKHVGALVVYNKFHIESVNVKRSSQVVTFLVKVTVWNFMSPLFKLISAKHYDGLAITAWSRVHMS